MTTNMEPQIYPSEVAAGCAGTPTELRFSAAKADTLAKLAKALSHPVRVQIIDLLHRYRGEVCVCELERHFDLAQPTISHHLKVLREAHLVDADQRGLWVYYTIKPGALDPLRELLGELD